MKVAEQQAIRKSTAAILVEWANNRQPPFTGDVADEFKDAITAAHLVADEARLDLQRWVDAARRSGLSWTDIGAALAISKQAAQQRFKLDDPDEEAIEAAGEKVVRLGVHAFNEMRILAEEGDNRSEEHTSELQSLMRISYAVFCLKKKKTTTYHTTLQQIQ